MRTENEVKDGEAPTKAEASDIVYHLTWSPAVQAERYPPRHVCSTLIGYSLLGG